MEEQKEMVEAQGAKQPTVKRLQFKTLGALREMVERIKGSEVLTKEELKQFEKLATDVRERWIKKQVG